ncbi:MAG: RNA methyltransferase [Proteobacteria bacterium]|jgi:tRNA G18 (ribose-2'-O)-methylase SpoU|nr:RNA methyltransferase [Pseudomonadota bacterium]
MNLKPAPAATLELYSKLKESGIGTDKFIADSSRVVLKLLQTNIPIHSLLATREWIEAHQASLQHIPEIFYASLEDMQKIVGYSLHQGVMCLAQRPADCTLEEMLGQTILVLDGIAKADNVGAIIRNAAAFNFTHVLVDASTVHPFQRRAVRTSMGNVYGLKVHQTDNLPQSLSFLASKGYQIIGFENRPQATLLHETQFQKNCAFIIGSEAIGIRPDVLPTLTQMVRIPINQEVFALNAACASSVAMYAISLQLKTTTKL